MFEQHMHTKGVITNVVMANDWACSHHNHQHSLPMTTNTSPTMIQTTTTHFSDCATMTTTKTTHDHHHHTTTATTPSMMTNKCHIIHILL
jgi:hypothetical protein